MRKKSLFSSIWLLEFASSDVILFGCRKSLCKELSYWNGLPNGVAIEHSFGINVMHHEKHSTTKIFHFCAEQYRNQLNPLLVIDKLRRWHCRQQHQPFPMPRHIQIETLQTWLKIVIVFHCISSSSFYIFLHFFLCIFLLPQRKRKPISFKFECYKTICMHSRKRKYDFSLLVVRLLFLFVQHLKAPEKLQLKLQAKCFRGKLN